MHDVTDVRYHVHLFNCAVNTIRYKNTTKVATKNKNKIFFLFWQPDPRQKVTNTYMLTGYCKLF